MTGRRSARLVGAVGNQIHVALRSFANPSFEAMTIVIYRPARLLVLYFLASLTFSMDGANAQEKTPFETLVNETRQAIQRNRKQYQIPGVAAAIFNREETLWQECFGVRDLDTRRPVTPDTSFAIQSASKAVTATAIMLAVQDGRVDLDQPITNYAPEFTINSAFEDNPQNKITLRRLLNHTASFPGESSGGNNSISGRLPFHEYCKTIGSTWLIGPVGTKHYYGNISIDMAGHILEKSYGRPFAEVIQQQIFDPLGMSRSFVDTAEINGDSENVAKGSGPDFAHLPNYVPMSASGGMRMSIQDAVRFVQFHLNRGNADGKVLLQPRLLEEMYARSVRVYEKGNSVWYGLGVESWQEAGTYTISHGGAGFGFRFSMRWYPEYGIGVVMMANGFDEDYANWEATRFTLREMVSRGIAKKLPTDGVRTLKQFLSNTPNEFLSDRTEVPPLKPSPYRSQWKRYLGRYRITYGGGFELSAKAKRDQSEMVLKEKTGYLVLQYRKSEWRLHMHEPGLFFIAPLHETIDFRKAVPTLANLALERIQ